MKKFIEIFKESNHYKYLLSSFGIGLCGSCPD